VGAEPWSYFVPYRADLQAALDDLKQQEFQAGRYNMGEEGVPASSIEEAREQGDADGTRSILDMDTVIDAPHDIGGGEYKFCCVAPLARDQLIELYGTETPTRSMIESNMDVYECVDRGLGIYVIAHDDRGQPSEIFFAGYSFD
jgi:hypothetical protein